MIFGFNLTMLGFDKKFEHGYDELYQQLERDIESAKTEL
jgi:hypothetical protein